jgi:hypothetical protein
MERGRGRGRLIDTERRQIVFALLPPAYSKYISMSNEGPLPPAHVQIKHGCTMRMDGVRLVGRRNGYTKIGEGLLSSGECVL